MTKRLMAMEITKNIKLQHGVYIGLTGPTLKRQLNIPLTHYWRVLWYVNSSRVIVANHAKIKVLHFQLQI